MKAYGALGETFSCVGLGFSTYLLYYIPHYHCQYTYYSVCLNIRLHVESTHTYVSDAKVSTVGCVHKPYKNCVGYKAFKAKIVK